MNPSNFARNQKIKTMVAGLFVGLLVSGILTVILVLMSRGYPSS
jgi:tetrahydromethanopterin S-methyltransferase subunit F